MKKAAEDGQAHARPDGAQAIRRAMEIMRTVAQLQRSGATSSRIARATGLSRSTASRILRSLADERMLQLREEGRTYGIGPLTRELGLAAISESAADEVWRPAVHELARRTRLTSYLMARSGNEAVCLVCVQGTAAIRAMPIEVGQRVPLGIGAGSLVILAALDDEEVGRLLLENATQLALFPGGQTSSIRRRIDQVRQQGFSVSSGTMAAGLTGVGVLIRSKEGFDQLALTVSAVAPSIPFGEAAALASQISSLAGKISPQ